MLKLEDLSGVLPALISPLRRDGTVDEPAVARLVARMTAGGVSGLVALGSTGEAASLDESARRRILSTVIAATAGRLPVICGVAQSHLAAAQREVQAAARLGAAGVLVTPPFYYPIDQATVLSFYRRLAEESPMPVMLYNIPQFTKVVAQPATVATLAHEGTIVGIKDSSRDFEYFESVCVATRGLPDFRIFTGSDTMLLASLAMGGAGTICGGANIAPGWVVRIFDDFERGDLKAARTHQDLLLELVLAVRAGVFPSAIKAALHLQGLCEPWLAPPVAPLGEAPLSVLRQQLDHWGLLAPADAAQPRLP